jgi:hypothetical protein
VNVTTDTERIKTKFGEIDIVGRNKPEKSILDRVVILTLIGGLIVASLVQCDSDEVGKGMAIEPKATANDTVEAIPDSPDELWVGHSGD